MLGDVLGELRGSQYNDVMFRSAACTVAACIVLGMSSAKVQSPGYSLRFVPKENQELRYKLTGTLETAIGTANLSSTVRYRVIRVAGDGVYTLQVTTEDSLVKVGSQEIRAPAPVTFFTYRPSGEVSEITGLDPDADKSKANPESYRMTNLTRFYPPEGQVTVGQSWTRELKTDGKTVGVPIKASFTAEAVEKVGDVEAVRVKGTVREDAVGSTALVEATFWISPVDGVEIKSESKWTGVMVPGSPTPTTGSLSRILVKEGASGGSVVTTNNKVA